MLDDNGVNQLKERRLTLSNHRHRYKKFLQRLRQARLEANLTQVEVAEILGKPQSFISKCETGERRVDFVELLTFAEIYQKPLSFFEVMEQTIEERTDR